MKKSDALDFFQVLIAIKDSLVELITFPIQKITPLEIPKLIQYIALNFIVSHIDQYNFIGVSYLLQAKLKNASILPLFYEDNEWCHADILGETIRNCHGLLNLLKCFIFH